MNTPNTAQLIGGVPSENTALFHRIRFSAGDPAAWILKPDGTSLLIIRDIEADRASRDAIADEVQIPTDHVPVGGLSGDRATATAQATAECLRAMNPDHVLVDRSTPFIYVHELIEAGVSVRYDAELGVVDRRSKSEDELSALQKAQSDTESVMAEACQLIARASPDATGILQHEGSEITSERIRLHIDQALLALGYDNPGSIVAGGPQAADCHAHGTGPLRTSQPVIIDIFPHSKQTHYNGDCTRTVVNGDIPDEVLRMHVAVVEAKAAGIAAINPEATGEHVHQATIDMIRSHGYHVGLPPEGADESWCGMVHGTGHGVGLLVHEPPLLDFKGPQLVAGDVLTVEPGLYSRSIGGIRVEDMVAVTSDGCLNFNHLPEGLTWT